jgi:hypothetical protein
MNAQITPEQVQNVVALSAIILLVVALRLIGLAVWNRWFKDLPDDNLTQEERDERRLQRRRQR